MNNWNDEGVVYEEYYEKNAEMTPYYNDLVTMRETNSDEAKEVDRIAYERLMEQAIKDSNDPNNYKNSINKGK